MPINWDATGSMLAGWGSLASAGAVAFTAHKAAETLEKWRTKKVEERKLEHAERVLVATYRVRDAMRSIRSPILHGVEIKAAQLELEADDGWQAIPAERRGRFVSAQVYVQRIIRTDAAWDDLFQVMPLAKALFGDALEAALEKLAHLRWITRVNAEAFADADGADPQLAIKIRRELNTSDERKGEDDVSVAIKDAIKSIEAECLALLRTKPR